MEIKEQLEIIRQYINGGINADKPVEEIQKANDILSAIDNVESEYKKQADELYSCKESIVKMVRRTPSADAKQPVDDIQVKSNKSLLDIAKELQQENKI